MTEYTYVRDSATAPWYTDQLLMGFVNFVIGLIEFLLGVRLVLHFLSAGTGNAFMAWLDSVTGQLIGPFAGIFPDLSIGGFIIELSTIFAMIAYAVIGWLIARLITLLLSAARAV